MILKTVTIGTAADCDICVHTDPYVSARHARIDQHDDGEFTIQDLGSSNGTFVRRAGLPGSGLVKVRLGTAIDLKAGDIIRVGRTEMPWRTA